MPDNVKSAATYWWCQLLGWTGMIAIEMVNYTFFIVRKFDLAILTYFLLCGALGLLLTHIFRRLLPAGRLFSMPVTRIWFTAFGATLLIALLMVVFSETIFLLLGFRKEGTVLLRPLELVSYVMNWMRYVGVWIIIYFLYRLLRQNAEIRNEKLLFENIAKTTELELLKMQLNPHFLFNALNSIKALVLLHPQKSRDAIVTLSELLRFTLQYGKSRYVPLQSEWEEVQKYLQLEQLRFGDRLQIQATLEVALVAARFPPALLLTLVENAIKHGVARHLGNHTIELRAQSVGADRLQVDVVNTGTYAPKDSEGIGLKHIVRRLEELYGPDACFTIGCNGTMVTATLKIPLTYAN